MGEGSICLGRASAGISPAMPSPAQVKKAFALDKGQDVGGWSLAKVRGTRRRRAARPRPNPAHTPWLVQCRMGHQVTEENELYEFPTTLTLAPPPGGGSSGGRQEVERAVTRHLQGCHIIYSPYGSPYATTFDTAVAVEEEDEEDDEGGPSFRVTCHAKAVRRRDIPTLGEVKREERQAAGVADDVPESGGRAGVAGGPCPAHTAVCWGPPGVRGELPLSAARPAGAQRAPLQQPGAPHPQTSATWLA